MAQTVHHIRWHISLIVLRLKFWLVIRFSALFVPWISEVCYTLKLSWAGRSIDAFDHSYLHGLTIVRHQLLKECRYLRISVIVSCVARVIRISSHTIFFMTWMCSELFLVIQHCQVILKQFSKFLLKIFIFHLSPALWNTRYEIRTWMQIIMDDVNVEGFVSIINP